MISKSDPESKLGLLRDKLGRLRSKARLVHLPSIKSPIVRDGDLLEPLLPVADRETYLRYAAAFDTIIERNVSCVAVTGPYGAGKTSLINAFKENYSKLKFIRISLATFEHDVEKGVASSRIEKSILQQLIYSAGRNKLEYSRFKKIRKPTWLLTKAVLLSIFTILTGFATIYWKKVEEFATEAHHWQQLSIGGSVAIFWLLLLFSIVHGILKTSTGLSITKLSLKKAEIETEDKSKESVFNKHLDEIVYFFQETPCDIVIIEDLDRFKKTEIFTKIREINQLINANPDVRPRNKKKIVFLFAIRDDLFQGKDRTKFFDLLIPVIPFVSAGNAYNVLHNKLIKNDLRKGLQDKFLRQVTVYVTDNRHLVNIVNEYSLYRRNLFDSNLDANKLFSIILYKVFFPSDFGKLHMNDGVLAGLAGELQDRRKNKRKELIQKLDEIGAVEQEIRQGQINSREALASAYVGYIQRQYNEPVRGFSPADTGLNIDIHDDLESIFSALQRRKDIRVTSARGHNLGILKVSEMEHAIHPGLSIKERLSAIERNVNLEEEGIAKTRAALQTQILNVRYLPINRAFSADEIREKVSTFDHSDLFLYLISEGLLGEDYDDYTSYFHKGAITRADRQYVQRFNRDDEIDFSEKIDTPSEILLILDDGLFGKPQGFNITLVDHVLGIGKGSQNGLSEGLQAFPAEAFRFLQAYYSEGKYVEKLLRLLVENWGSFLDSAAECEDPLPHVREIFEKARDATICALRQPSEFLKFIERSAPEVFDCPRLIERIPLLTKSNILIDDIGFSRLPPADRAGAIDTVAAHRLWKITPRNIKSILMWQGVEDQEARSRMFLSLISAPDSVFSYVVGNINIFTRNCFLKVDSTVAEPQEGIEQLLSVEGLEEELGMQIIARQEARLTFSKVPNVYWTSIVNEQKYVISWDNFERFLAEARDFSTLAPIFDSADVISELATDRKKISEELFGMLVEANGIDLESYKKLIGADLGEISKLPTAIDHDKKLHLIRSMMIDLDNTSWRWLEGEPALRVALIEERVTAYEEIKHLTLDDEELSGLLKSKISPLLKRILLQNAGTIECGDDISLRTEVINILASDDTEICDFNEDFVESIIGAAPEEEAIRLLIRMIPTWEETRVMQNLEAIGSPYDEIADYGKRPLISKSEINLALAEALQNCEMISQFKQEERGVRIITKRKDPSR